MQKPHNCDWVANVVFLIEESHSKFRLPLPWLFEIHGYKFTG